MQNPIISDHKKLMTPTLYYMQNITSKVLSSGILSPEEGLVWGFFPNITFTFLKILPLYTKQALAALAKILVLALSPSGDKKQQVDMFWAGPPHCQSEDLV